MEATRERISDREVFELTVINRIVCHANAAIQTNDLLPTVASEIVQSLGWDRVVIGLLQVDSTTLHVVVDSRTDENTLLGITYATPTDFGLLLEVLHAGHTSVLQASTPELAHTHVGSLLVQAGFQTAIAMVLHNEDKLFGAMVVGSVRKHDVFPEDVHLLETLCEHLAVSIQRMYRYEELEQGNRLRSAFLAKVTHELRTPITSIIGYAQMMQRGKFGPLPDEMEEPVMFVVQSGNRINRLVNDLLDFSKMEAGHLSLDLATVNLLPIIHNVVGMIRPLVIERGLELVVDVDPDLPPVRGNSDRLEQILTNLLSNAIKFTDKGTITVRAVRHDDRVRLSVQDMGIGIAPEHQALVFGEYQQIKNQHTLRFAGTGLGLAISRGLVELMGGTMSLESAPGAGSTFYCDLRIATHA